MFDQLKPVLTGIQGKVEVFNPLRWMLDPNAGASQTVYEFSAALAIFLVFWFGKGLFSKLIIRFLLKMTGKTKSNVDDHLVSAFSKPIRLFFFFLGVYLALWSMPLEPVYDPMFSKLFRTAVIILVGAGLYNFIGIYAIFQEDLENLLGAKVDRILIPFLTKVLKVVIIALGFTVVAEEWGYDVNSFIAGLGLGGLAFALAAKDTVANIFGGIVIITDKPFSIGDWVLTPSVEGVVEDINFRSTKIRVFSQAVVTVPNSTLANEPVTNWSRMGKRRLTFRLGVTYSTSRDKLSKCVEDLRSMLAAHPGVHPETIFVRFDTFGDSSLEILLYFFTHTTDWGEYLAVKEDINFKIMALLEDLGVSIAFPSTSVYFETPVPQADKKKV